MPLPGRFFLGAGSTLCPGDCRSRCSGAFRSCRKSRELLCSGEILGLASKAKPAWVDVIVSHTVPHTSPTL